jgi:hypothetical protein
LAAGAPAIRRWGTVVLAATIWALRWCAVWVNALIRAASGTLRQ